MIKKSGFRRRLTMIASTGDRSRISRAGCGGVTPALDGWRRSPFSSVSSG